MASSTYAQIPVEIFTGTERASFDMMYFKYTKKRNGENSKFLFFNRNRCSVDYRITSSEYLPVFGLTGAISYNPASWKGLAPVAVTQINNRRISMKAGVQYAYQKKRFNIFTWAVSETMGDPNIDLFFLGRYTPRLSSRTDLFLQAETLNSIATSAAKEHIFIQRIRVGLKQGYWQFGAGIDLSQTGRRNFSSINNAGIFLRHEF